MESPVNPTNFARYQREQEQWKMRQERGFARGTYRIFNLAFKEAAGALAASLDPLSGPYVNGGMDLALQELYSQQYALITARWRRAMKPDQKWHARALETKDFETRLEEYLAQFFLQITAGKVTQVSETTRRDIRRTIQRGVEQELGVRAIASQLQRVGRGINRNRALVIARTEVNTASNAATQFSAEALGIQYKRRWVAASDERTRSTHALADGQLRGENEAFDVGGVKLMRPGDPNGPAKEVVNCRCSIALITE